MRSLLLLLAACFALCGLPTARATDSAAAAEPAERDAVAAANMAAVAIQTGEDLTLPEDSGQSGRTMILLLGYSIVIVAASVFGGWVTSVMTFSHTQMQSLMSLVGGLMLGIGLLHLLPHGLYELGPDGVDDGVRWMILGVISMFLLIRMFHFHQHGTGEPHHECGHDHDDGHGHVSTHKLSWTGVFLGLSLHTLIDGMALGASVQADAAHSYGWGFFGLGTFLAIGLHKPLDAVSITTLMQTAGWSRGARHAVNIAFAMMCPLGAILFVLGVAEVGGNPSVVIGAALTFSAGVFLCISLGDLLPEMEFHAHNRVRLTGLLLAGLGLAWAIGFLEPEHAHRHASAVTASPN